MSHLELANANEMPTRGPRRSKMQSWLCLLLCIVVPVSSTGCSWIKAHGNGGAWARAANPIQKNHWGSLALLATVPFVYHNDDRWSRMAARRQEIAGSHGASKGDLVMGVLAASPLIAASFSAFAPEKKDEALEFVGVAVEATAVNIVLTQVLKKVVRRERPNNNSGRGGRAKPPTKSFPSGHVTTAMTGAALTGRWLREKNPWFGIVEFMLYGGVAYVAFTRMENDKHYPSDVVGSAVLAHYVTTTIWDAHYGVKGKEGILHTIRKHAMPMPMENGMGILFHWEF